MSFSRFKFRQLARTGRGKVVWFEVLPESRDRGIVNTPSAGPCHLRNSLSPVLQCTGFVDERKVPVYEEDIVEVTIGALKGIGAVVWREGSFYLSSHYNVPIFPMSEVDSIKVLGNRYIAGDLLYHRLYTEFRNMEVDESTFLKTVIYTGVRRPDGDDIVLYLERDFDENRLYLTDLGETAMFIATCGVEPGFEEVKREVDEENVVEKAREMIEEIREKFKQKVGHMKWRVKL